MSQAIMDEGKKYFTFLAGGELFAVEVDCLVEIIKPEQLKKTRKGRNIAGTLVFRGSKLAVVDIGKKFYSEPVRSAHNTCVIVVTSHDITAGLLVDSASDVIELKNSDIRPPIDRRTGVATEYIQAFAVVKDKLIIILDCGSLLFSEKDYITKNHKRY